MKMIIITLCMITSAMYCMDTWGELTECTKKIKEKRQELEAIMKNNNDRRVVKELEGILEAINKYALEKEVIHHRIIHRGIEPEKINKAKL